MSDHTLTNDHQNPLSHVSIDHHQLRDSCESLSFRHFYHQSPLHSRHIHNTLEKFLQESSLGYISDTQLSPESSPLRVPGNPESRRPYTPSRSPQRVFHHHRILYRCTFSLRHHDGNIHSIAVARGLVFTSSSSPCIRAWQLTNCSEMGFIRASLGEVRSMLAYDNMLFTSHKDNKIRVWNITPSILSSTFATVTTSDSNNNSDVHRLINNNSDVRLINTQKIATLPKPNRLRFLLLKTNSLHKDIISCMAYNVGDGLLYTGSYDKTVKAWSMSDKKCVDTFIAHADNINSMVINEDGYLFTCSSDGTLKMWSKVSGQSFHTLTMTLHFHPFPFHALALKSISVSEPSFLYGGSSDGCIYFWEQQMTGGYVRRGCIQGHQFGVLSVAVMENMVVSGSADSRIKIWRRKGVYHECMGVLEGHNGPVKSVVACLEEESFVRSFLVFSSGLDRSFKAWRVTLLLDVKGVNQGMDFGDGE